MVQPEHVNLGLAIDLPGKDDTRTLVVRPIKAARRMSFAQFWSAYEDIVRKARSGKLIAEDFAGTTISLTNPGSIGTNHSVPAADAGPGHDHRRRCHGVPRRVPGRQPRTLAELGHQQDHHPDLHLRPPGYPGCRSPASSCAGSMSCCWARAVSTTTFSRRCAFPTSRSGGRRPARRRSRQHGPSAGLIDTYRSRGHLLADTDPLNYRQRRHPDLDVLTHGLTLWDLDREFPVDGFAGQERMKLRDVLGVLRDSYCRTVGVEYMHILDPEQRALDAGAGRGAAREAAPSTSRSTSCAELNAAEAFETFLQTKYVGQKRFSLEGGETVIPLLDAVLDKAAEHELDEVVIGMAHRGRLNVLANIVGKPYAQIFPEFEGNLDPGQAQGSGDVKYHLGAEGTHFRCPATASTRRHRWPPTLRTWKWSTPCCRASSAPNRTCWTWARPATP